MRESLLLFLHVERVVDSNDGILEDHFIVVVLSFIEFLSWARSFYCVFVFNLYAWHFCDWKIWDRGLGGNCLWLQSWQCVEPGFKCSSFNSQSELPSIMLFLSWERNKDQSKWAEGVIEKGIWDKLSRKNSNCGLLLTILTASQPFLRPPLCLQRHLSP